MGFSRPLTPQQYAPVTETCSSKMPCLNELEKRPASRLHSTAYPMEGCNIELFNGRNRNACVKYNALESVADAHTRIHACRIDYSSGIFPSALTNLTPFLHQSAQIRSGEIQARKCAAIRGNSSALVDVDIGVVCDQVFTSSSQ